MRFRSKVYVLAVFALLTVSAAPVAALRQGGPQDGRQRQGFAPRDGAGGGMTASFEASSPAVGEAMPEVVVYRSSGEPISFQQLLGDRYTVVILGCLT